MMNLHLLWDVIFFFVVTLEHLTGLVEKVHHKGVLILGCLLEGLVNLLERLEPLGLDGTADALDTLGQRKPLGGVWLGSGAGTHEQNHLICYYDFFFY